MNNKDYPLYAHLNTQELFKQLKTTEQGLDERQVLERIRSVGENVIKETAITWFTLLKNQLNNPFIYLLTGIALIYFFTAQTTETIVILIIIIINSGIGFYQEYQSNKAMELLKYYLQNPVAIKRANKNCVVPINTLVPGDIITLRAGDIIPADCRFIKVDNIIIDESNLTGESSPIKKTDSTAQQPVRTLYEAQNIGFAGTTIIDGNGTAVIFATGTSTVLGTIATLTTQAMTKNKLAQETMQLARATFFLIIISLIIIFAINVAIKKEYSWLNLALFSAALAITVIPTALPIVITFCLTRGAKKLQNHKIIVKRLSSIEDLGSVEILCADKTGTLTENSLSVKNIYQDNRQTIVNAALSSTIIMMQKEGIPKGFDRAIAEQLTPEDKKKLEQYSIIKELPFTYDRHRSITLAKNGHHYLLITKGPAENIINQCPLAQYDLNNANNWIQENELSANRVLAIATKTISSPTIETENLEKYNQYDEIGFISFTDPLKSTAAQAIKKAQEIGVQIKILSGDSADVCYTIAHQLGLENNKNNVVLGTEFENSAESQKNMLAHTGTIFARVTPEQKYQIISYLQKTHCVAYMGDGVNDAPALKTSNVGIAVSDATPVARQAAEIILLQKSLLNVILGIEEGRTIVINTLKYIKITISSNIGNFYSLAISSLLINYLPMLPLQLLSLDLVTDLPLIAISTDSVNKIELKRPLHYDIKDIGFATLLFGLISSPFDFMIFLLFKENPTLLQTCWFISSALTQLALIFSLRTQMPFWKTKAPSKTLIIFCLLATITITVLPFTKLGHTLLFFTQPTIQNITWIFFIVTGYFVTTEIAKLLYYKKITLNKRDKYSSG